MTLWPTSRARSASCPGSAWSETGDVRHCQGTVLADYVARSPEGQERAIGTNVFVFGADGRLASVTGFMAVAPASKQ